MKPQQHSTATNDQRPPKVVVNTRSHWLPAASSQSRSATRASSRDQKDTQAYSAQRDRYAPPPPDRYAPPPGYRDADQWYAPPSRTASRYDDGRYDRSSHSSKTSRNVEARAGYHQPQDHGRRDNRATASQNKRKALLREYKENARRQSEIERELGGKYPSQPASRRDRYSDASNGRR